MALTIYGESRGESREGKIAVGSVVLERVRRRKWYGKTVPEVCLKRMQFSCFNERDPNRGRLLNLAEQWDEAICTDGVLRECYGIASGLMDGSIQPNVIATHYHAVHCDPAWNDHMKRIATIGNHVFFLEV